MNRFSSLSTTVLLALLTSSVSAAAYATGTETSQRAAAIRETADPENLDAAPALDHQLIATDNDLNQAINPGSPENVPHPIDPPETAVASAGPANLKTAPESAPTDTAAVLKDSMSSAGLLESHNQSAAALGTTNIAMQRVEHRINLNQINAAATAAVAAASASAAASDQAAPVPEARALTASRKLKGNDQDQLTGSGGSVFEEPEYSVPASITVSFEHPENLEESFIMAGDTTVISYGTDEGNFLVSFKLRPLDATALKQLNLTSFRDSLTRRFSDKAGMLYGEYDIVSEKEEVTDNDKYLDLTLRAFLKKGADGILPDMQNFFYERNIVSHRYLATLSCEFQGRQAQAANVKSQFETFSPLCERILNSYTFNFE